VRLDSLILLNSGLRDTWRFRERDRERNEKAKRPQIKLVPTLIAYYQKYYIPNFRNKVTNTASSHSFLIFPISMLSTTTDLGQFNI
jgi:hypothetical protein